MDTALDMFRNTLRSIFMLDSAEELDFGIYRIMRIKKQEIDQWLDVRLKEIVEEQISNGMSSDYGEKKARLDDKVSAMQKEGYTTREIDNDRFVKKLREELAIMGDAEEMQAEVFTHLNTFFSRYYDKGDFVSQRRYKKDVYAIPYEGDEVKLYWANADQYYIKTGEYFKNYHFSLSDGKQVEFTLKEAETPMNDQKSKRELEHHFKLYEEMPVEKTDDGVLHFNFVYQLMAKTPNQSTLRTQAYNKLLELISKDYSDYKELTREIDVKKHTTLLMRHLTAYTEKNRQDYFIHKNLGAFLSRELDFYIKNEILVIDDIDTTETKKFLSHLAVVKAVKVVGRSIIALMAQLEEYQKKLWLKKKMVASADYLVTLDRIPESLYEEIGKNDKQREEWVKLYAIDQIKLGKGELPGMKAEYSVPLTPQFLRENNTLVVDTAFFSTEFQHQLLASIDHVDEQCNGLMVSSENFQALNLLQEKFGEQVKCVYIDPPYNTGGDDFVYKDNYQESSWLSCIYDRLLLTKPFFKEGGSIAVSIDIKELDKLIALMDMTLGSENRKANITVRRASLTGAKVINPGLVNISENVVMYSNGNGKWNPQDAFREKGYDNRYTMMITNIEEPMNKWQFSTVLEEFAKFKNIKKSKLKKTLGDSYEDELLQFAIDNASAIVQLGSLDLDSVGNDVVELQKKSLANPEIIYHLPREGYNDYYLIRGKVILFYKDRLRRIGGKMVPVEKVSDIWDDVLPNDIHNEGGVVLKKGKKPEKLVDRIFESTTQKGDLVLDYFAGSGTSGAVGLKSGRKFINVEVNEYFDSIPLRRIKNTLHGDTSGVTDKYEWKGGGMVKYIRLEQYEDTLNNIELKENHLAQSVNFDESYMLGYMLDVESRESLMNLTRFEHPFTPKMKITHGTVREEQTVDLPETFNYLIGLYVDQYEWPKDGMQVVSGETRKGEKTLVVWRDMDLVDDKKLAEYVGGRDDVKSYRRIFVNCDNNLAAMLPASLADRVMLTETEFLKRMFDNHDI